ncbi:thioredoxin family protein [Aquimarina sp. I32.4]|uniref:thioredoxin family protein n=1 Tax=Aquimarina sp. I32.4 TaxID=2053903 RepID=UPI000CDEB1DC|nr:thioredoxin family protein [Aquimarina sp. I32.4]
MRRIFLFFVLFGFIGFSQQESKDIVWLQDFDLAKKEAKANKKSILMYFSGSDWCRPCKLLKEDFFDHKKFSNYKKDFVFLLIDIPRNNDLLTDKQREQNYSLLNDYNDNKSFPLVLILSSKGKILDKISGYSSLRNPKFHFELLDKFSK